MLPLNLPLACAPAKDLRPSRARCSSACKAKRTNSWKLGSWNVRSVLNAGGPVETARRGGNAVQAEAGKAVLVVRELNRYSIKVAALQETKCATHRVGESMVIAAGRAVPEPGQPLQRGEGVAIVLSGSATGAWREAGEQWKAWSSRLVTAQLQPGKNKADRLHVLSCYAPTRAASRAEKDRFYEDLQQALDGIPSNEPYVLLGDFNARVGSRHGHDDLWNLVRGPHGFGACNYAGDELLSFLSTNEAMICNTWFEKRNIHKHTWQHPKSKQWHCIDFAIMRRRDRQRCLDATVMRGADCNSDHQLLCIRVKMCEDRSHHKCTPPLRRKRFDVDKLVSNEAFQVDVVERAQSEWPHGGSAEDKWSAMRSALTEAGDNLGYPEKISSRLVSRESCRH